MNSLMPVRGISDAAQLVKNVSRRNLDRLTRLESFTKQRAFEALWDCWKSCSVANWDGYGGLPVEQETFRRAYCFIEALPLGYPLPSVGAEPDGHLTFEWHRNLHWTLSVSISPEGTLHYAALLGTEDPRGSSLFFDEIPENLLFLIRRACRL